MHVLPAEDVYAGGTNRPLVLGRAEAANTGLDTVELRAAFIGAATDIVDALTVDGHDREGLNTDLGRLLLHQQQ